MHQLEKLIAAIEAINEAVGRVVAWLALGMVVVTAAIVILRYLFQVGWIAMQEAVLYMHGALFMLGAAYTLKHDGHVRVDILYRGFSPRGKAWVDLTGTLLLLFPVCLFIAVGSWEFVTSAWALREASGEAGGLPWLYVLKSAIPAMALLLLLQGAALALRSILVLAGEAGAGAINDSAREL